MIRMNVHFCIPSEMRAQSSIFSIHALIVLSGYLQKPSGHNNIHGYLTMKEAYLVSLDNQIVLYLYDSP